MRDAVWYLPRKNGVTLIAVTLNDPDDWDDHTALSGIRLLACAASCDIRIVRT